MLAPDASLNSASVTFPMSVRHTTVRVQGAAGSQPPAFAVEVASMVRSSAGDHEEVSIGDPLVRGHTPRTPR